MKRAAKKNQSAKKNRDRLMNDISANTDKHIKDVLRHRQTERQTGFYINDGVILFNRRLFIPVTEENRTETVSS